MVIKISTQTFILNNFICQFITPNSYVPMYVLQRKENSEKKWEREREREREG